MTEFGLNTATETKPDKDPILTKEDLRLREIYALAGKSEGKFPVVENVRQLFWINELEVPYYNPDTKMGIRHPDHRYCYKWVDKHDVSQLVGHSTNAIWCPVNITNHPHIRHQGLVHPVYGTVIFKDSVILCFTPEKYRDAHNKVLVEDYIQASKPVEEKDKTTGGSEMMRITGGRGDLRKGTMEAVEGLSSTALGIKGEDMPLGD